MAHHGHSPLAITLSHSPALPHQSANPQRNHLTINSPASRHLPVLTALVARTIPPSTPATSFFPISPSHSCFSLIPGTQGGSVGAETTAPRASTDGRPLQRLHPHPESRPTWVPRHPLIHTFPFCSIKPVKLELRCGLLLVKYLLSQKWTTGLAVKSYIW